MPKYDQDELRNRLTPEQYAVTQEAATEAPFNNQYDAWFDDGWIYVDVVSGEPLFSSTDKLRRWLWLAFFTKPIEKAGEAPPLDTSHGMFRTEVKSADADSHLGHVFTDGPMAAGGLRYCINSAAMCFVPVADLEKAGYGEYKSLFEVSKKVETSLSVSTLFFSNLLP